MHIKRIKKLCFELSIITKFCSVVEVFIQQYLVPENVLPFSYIYSMQFGFRQSIGMYPVNPHDFINETKFTLIGQQDVQRIVSNIQVLKFIREWNVLEEH